MENIIMTFIVLLLIVLFSSAYYTGHLLYKVFESKKMLKKATDEYIESLENYVKQLNKK